jgi:hypothetical protein
VSDWEEIKEIRSGSILVCIPGLQSTIEHASIVARKAGGRGRNGHEVDPSEAVIIEELVSNRSTGGPIAVCGGGQDFFWRNGAIGGSGWSHAAWLGGNASM